MYLDFSTDTSKLKSRVSDNSQVVHLLQRKHVIVVGYTSTAFVSVTAGTAMGLFAVTNVRHLHKPTFQ